MSDRSKLMSGLGSELGQESGSVGVGLFDDKDITHEDEENDNVDAWTKYKQTTSLIVAVFGVIIIMPSLALSVISLVLSMFRVHKKWIIFLHWIFIFIKLFKDRVFIFFILINW